MKEALPTNTLVGFSRQGELTRFRLLLSSTKQNQVGTKMRVRTMLKNRTGSNDSRRMFTGDGAKAFLATLLNHKHSKIRDKVGLQKDFVLHSFRHSMLTRLGEAGV